LPPPTPVSSLLFSNPEAVVMSFRTVALTGDEAALYIAGSAKPAGDAGHLASVRASSAALLVELTPDNVQAAGRIEVKPEHLKFVAPVVESLAEAYVH
jgi:hypothetical protein